MGPGTDQLSNKCLLNLKRNIRSQPAPLGVAAPERSLLPRLVGWPLCRPTGPAHRLDARISRLRAPLAFLCGALLRETFCDCGALHVPSCEAPPRQPGRPPAPLARGPRRFVREAGETSLLHPFQWCIGCFCGLGLVSTNKSCSTPPISFQDLPLHIYVVIFGTGIFVFMLSLIFCCYFISKLRNRAQSERYGYKEMVLKGDAKNLQLHGQTCAVFLEDFEGKDELGVLPCQHAFHRKCLVKWLEVRCVCPMCNKPIAGPTEAAQSTGILLDELCECSLHSENWRGPRLSCLL
ncbi:RING finger protein 122-like [Nycticebus coucang]|uniref:RING finger protein 122-like n=1 Tax=Nycticebus coucang TaxID=9470 RepID=UPI00234CA525|nr:RING finger protein 122-like [Nycticebus coucang]